MVFSSILLFYIPNFTNAQLINHTNITKLSNSTGLSTDVSVSTSASGQYVYSVWRSNENGNDEIFFRTSTDGGNTFGKIINLSNNPGPSYEPKISADGSNVYVVWTDNNPGTNQIFFRTSNDYGNTFSKTINLSNSTGQAGIERLASIGGVVYVVWRDNVSGNPEVYFRKSNDYGNTFSKTINLSEDEGLSGLPQLAASSNHVYVVWQDTTLGNDEIFFRTSTDGGNTFGKIINLSNNTQYSFEPKISADGSNVYVVWTEREPTGFHIKYIQSINNGTIFGNPIDLNQIVDNVLNITKPVSLLGPAEHPVIQSFQKTAYVVWTDSSSGNNEIMMVRITDNGTNILPKVINLSNSIGYSIQPDLEVNGNNVYVIWSDSTPGNHDILATASADNGNTFANFVNLSNDAGPSFVPFVSAYTDGADVVWEDGTPGIRSAFFTSLNIQK